MELQEMFFSEIVVVGYHSLCMVSSDYIGVGEEGGGGGWAPMAPPLDPPLVLYYTLAKIVLCSHVVCLIYKLY